MTANQNYFKKLADVETEPTQKLDAIIPLVDRISIGKIHSPFYSDCSGLLFDGKDLFKNPLSPASSIRPFVSIINPTAEDSPTGMIYIGTSTCCNAEVYVYNVEDKFSPPLVPRIIFPVDFNVYDIIPLDNRALLAIGSGCSGAGVRLIDHSNHRIDDIVSSKEHRDKGLQGQGYSVPYFTFEDKIIAHFTQDIDISSRLEKYKIDLDKAKQNYSLCVRERFR